MDYSSKNTSISRYFHGKTEKVDDNVIIEQPVSLTVNGDVWLTFMCTPVDLEALAAGFLFNEKAISSIDEIADMRVCEHMDNIDVWLNHSISAPADWRRTSGCTGGYTAVILEEISPIPDDRLRLSSNAVLDLIHDLLKTQEIYRQSGGVHASALASPEGILFQTEDVGRHNTLDKIAGRLLLERLQPASRIILTTGRISSEMLQKSARMGASVLISRTSPTSMSVELAEKLNITLIGYARGNRFNVYSHPGRILLDS